MLKGIPRNDFFFPPVTKQLLSISGVVFINWRKSCKREFPVFLENREVPVQKPSKQ